jgi:TonB family protein
MSLLRCLRGLRIITAGSVILGALSRLPAQDVTVSALEWTNPAHAPDTLPVVKHTPKLTFPRELKTTTEIGYVVVDAMISEKAERLVWAPHASLPTYLQSYAVDDRFTFQPARRDGKPVISEVTLALIFNPASAATNTPDAAPRLQQVALVRVPGDRRVKAAIPDRVVMADLTIGADGLVAAVEHVPDDLQEPLTIAAKNWRFSPARRAGEPVAAEVRAPFIVVTGLPRPAGGKSVPPRVTNQTKPIYPFAMRASGMRGEVLVDFVVDIEGRPRNAFVVRSLNPAFDDPALDAVAKWRFEPGRVNGVPVNTHMQVPIVFQLQGTLNGGTDGIAVKHKADLSKLPPELRYDTAPKLIGSARPVYPYAALAARKEGRAVVTYLVDERGHIARAEVKEATTPEFGQALLAAIARFTYQPAIKDGHPSLALLSFEQEFNRNEEYGLVSDADLDLLYREQKKRQTIVGARELDHRLNPISRQPPVFPVQLEGRVNEGEATIEFLIDEDGRARLPRILSATNDAFGYAASQAVARWRFEEPTHGGRPVVTRAVIPIKFQSQSAKELMRAAKPGQ